MLQLTIRHNDFCYIDQLINSIRKTAFSRQIKARYYSAQRLEIRSRKKSISIMGLFSSKQQEDENCLRIEDLPVEIMVEIISYLDKTEKINVFSMVNRRWFDIASNEIVAITIKWPQKKSQFNFWKFCKSFWKLDSGHLLSQDIQNLIVRFPRLKNLELATKITNKDMILPLISFEFDGTLEFEISPDLIPTKNPPNLPFTASQPFTASHPFALSRRIKINPAEEKDFELVYDRNQIISFGISFGIFMPCRDDEIDSVVEEIRSLDNVSEIIYQSCHSVGYHEKVIGSILSRPHLKQIIFSGVFKINRFDTEEEFPKNWNVEEIKFYLHFLMSFKLWNKLFDALPNIKKVKIIVVLSRENEFKESILLDYIKTISKLKHLKSLNVAICSRYNETFDAKRFGNFPEMICEINFPMKSEVVIADFPSKHWIRWNGPMDLTNLVEKKEGENPKIVNGLGQ